MRCCLILLIVVLKERRIRPRQKDRLRRILESCSFSFRGRHCKRDRTRIKNYFGNRVYFCLRNKFEPVTKNAWAIEYLISIFDAKLRFALLPF